MTVANDVALWKMKTITVILQVAGALASLVIRPILGPHRLRDCRKRRSNLLLADLSFDCRVTRRINELRPKGPAQALFKT